MGNCPNGELSGCALKVMANDKIFFFYSTGKPIIITCISLGPLKPVYYNEISFINSNFFIFFMIGCLKNVLAYIVSI